MKKILLTFMAVLLAHAATAQQNLLIGKSAQDQFLASFWAQKNNASNAITGLGVNGALSPQLQVNGGVMSIANNANLGTNQLFFGSATIQDLFLPDLHLTSQATAGGGASHRIDFNSADGLLWRLSTSGDQTFALRTPAGYSVYTWSRRGGFRIIGDELTSPASLIDVESIWNNAVFPFTAFVLNIIDTASPADSKLMDLKVNGGTEFNVGKSGDVYQGDNLTLDGSDTTKTISFNFEGGPFAALTANTDAGFSLSRETTVESQLSVINTGATTAVLKLQGNDGDAGEAIEFYNHVGTKRFGITYSAGTGDTLNFTDGGDNFIFRVAQGNALIFDNTHFRGSITLTNGASPTYLDIDNGGAGSVASGIRLKKAGNILWTLKTQDADLSDALQLYNSSNELIFQVNDALNGGGFQVFKTFGIQSGTYNRVQVSNNEGLILPSNVTTNELEWVSGARQPATLTTPGNTITTVDSWAPANNSVTDVEVTFVSLNAAHTQAGRKKRLATFLNNAGTVTQIGATSTIGTDVDTHTGGPVVVTVDTDGSVIRLRVTGIAATDIDHKSAAKTVVYAQ